MNRSLPFTPRPQAGESPLNVLRRGATGNHHASTVRFAYALNCDLDHSITALGAVARNPERLGSTFEAMGLSAEDTAVVSHRRVGRARADDVEWNGLRVAIGDLQFRRSKLCMACYLEDGFASSQWDHVAAIACAKHQVLLDDACPCCGTAWTPVVDPLSCGCDPQQMAARQQRCGREVASVLERIIRTADQAGLHVLRGVWSVLQSWRAFGVQISRAVAANALWNLTAGRWPAAPDTQRTTSAVLIHPRVSLAPLLAASSPVCVGAARGLLTRKAPNVMAEYLDDIWWPSTTAMAVLGTNRVPFKNLVQAGHLTPREDGRHSAASINELLWRIKGCREGDVPMKPLSAHRVGSNPESLASLITKIKAGVIAFYYFPVETGLDGLLCESVVRPLSVTAIFGLKEVARRLGTNTESIRCAIQLGWLDGSKGTPRSAVEWSISSASLRAFNATYVFASAVAREHQVSALTIASRLRSAGLVAVSGPDVDGGVTYVFERSHMSHVDLASVLKGPYRSPAGRKTNSARAERGGTLTSQESAAILGISVRQLRDVTHAGWIAPVAMVQRRRVFEGKAVRELKRSLDEDFVSLPAAASTMDQSIAEFRRTWVYTQTISAHRFADRTLVRSEDLGRIQDIWQDSGTSTSIGRTLNRQRWLCPNLQKMEQMPSPTIIGTGTSKVRLYLRGAQTLAKYDMT